jgi:hypothetical protein
MLLEQVHSRPRLVSAGLYPAARPTCQPAAPPIYQAGPANRIVSNGTEIEDHKIVALAPLALMTMKRIVNDHVLPKGPAELAWRFGAELAAVRDSAAEGIRVQVARKPRYEGR